MDDVHYENIDRYEASEEYSSVVRECLSEGWAIRPRGFWTTCCPLSWVGIEHGWKIHLSSTPENAEATLRAACRVLSEAGVLFKYTSDERLLKMSFGKAWSRFQVGKFITVYPRSQVEFERVIGQLHSATNHLDGPHILTDRAYRDSSVVHYRYGAHVERFVVDQYGYRVNGFFLADGEWQEDARRAGFKVPPGIVDPFLPSIETSDDCDSGSPLLNGRFRVVGALKFSGTGGVYGGVDELTGKQVVIREVRGVSGVSIDEDRHALVGGLRRQEKILRKLSGTGLVPEFVDSFREWNNWFLVEERLEALTLWELSMDFYYQEEDGNSDDGFTRIKEKIELVAEGLKVIHRNNVVLRDLTKNNIMFTAQGQVKFIDLEFAHDLDAGGAWVKGWTPGYASKQQRASRRPAVEEDYYAFGVLVLDIIAFCASGLDLAKKQILDVKLPQVIADLGFPGVIHEMVCGLTHGDVDSRWTLDDALACLRKASVPSPARLMLPSRQEMKVVAAPDADFLREVESVICGLKGYFAKTECTVRGDRVWPASPQVFLTNPVSLQFGAAGVAFFLLRSGGRVGSSVLDWIEKKSISATCPSGLYSGLGGVALLLLQAGRFESAERCLESIRSNPAAISTPSLYFGAAGQGLIYLHFWRATGNSRYLDMAVNVAEMLISTATRSSQGWCWSNGGKVFLGMGDGQSGIALFFIYVSIAAQNDRYMAAARSALTFDGSHFVRIAGRKFWKTHVGADRKAPNSPHTRFGSAGVGSVCIRYFAATGDESLRDLALECSYAVGSRVTNKIWQDSGNSGFGEFLLDMGRFTGDSYFKNLACYQAAAVLPHAVEFNGNCAFAGPAHHKLCSDYSVGAAGIGIFLDRLVNGRGRFLMLDELIS